jgi:hypothetical protein
MIANSSKAAVLALGLTLVAGSCNDTLTVDGGVGEVCGVPAEPGPTECPAESGDIHAKPCSMPSGTTCVYPQPGGGWNACTCGCVNEFEFSCYGEGGGTYCPAEQPTPGSSCASALGSTCAYFPSTRCDCPPATGQWECQPSMEDWPCLSPPQPNSDPSGVAPTTPVKDLSPAEVTEWCTWNQDAYPSGGALPPNYPAKDGYAWGGGHVSCPEAGGCVQHLKVEHCVQNLALSTCEATLLELEDCARTMMNMCQRVGHGCGPLRRACGCSTTIVQLGDSFDSCSVPVE